MLITDQVATAPCTDGVQPRRSTFEAKPTNSRGLMNKPTDIPPTMRYFTYDLIAAANDWVKQTPAQQRKAAAQFAAAVEKYQRELDSMKSRISRDAWQFFRYAYDEEGIHDARLLSLKVGDGLKYIAVSENWYSAKSA